MFELGKGRRNGRSTYRRVKHSKEYYKQKRELEARKKALRNGEIYCDPIKIAIPLLQASGIITEEVVKKLKS